MVIHLLIMAAVLKINGQRVIGENIEKWLVKDVEIAN